MTFINRERIALLESKFHFQIEYCNVTTVALANVHVQVADCWRLDLSDLICVHKYFYSQNTQCIPLII